MIDGARTRDNRNHNPGLYQLSYDHHGRASYPMVFVLISPFLRRVSEMVRPTGIEPVTHGLEGRCSIQLSYGRGLNAPHELAEREGFEPPEPCGSAVFKTAAIDHSAISPQTIRIPRSVV